MVALDPAAMRKVNVATVLEALYRGQAMTLATLVARTGLSRRTVELILLELVDLEWVKVIAPDGVANGRGRPARLFAFRPESGHVLAVDIAHTRVTVTVADLRGTSIGSTMTRIEGEPDRDERLDVVRTMIHTTLDRAGLVPADITAMTIATPGNVNDHGAVDVRLSMRGWVGFSLTDVFADDFACPIRAENDAKLAVRGELWRGVVPGTDNVLWLMLAGVHHGLGIAINGQPYRGTNGAAGETSWAHSLGFDAIAEDPLARLAQHDRRGELTRLLSNRDPDTMAALDRFATLIAHGLSSLSWILAPQSIVLGGSTSTLLGESLLAKVRKEFVTTGPEFTDLHLSSLGEDAVTVGAIRRALDEVEHRLFDPLARATS